MRHPFLSGCRCPSGLLITLTSMVIVLAVGPTFGLPMTRMRVCVQSSDPLRLQSQCVYCNNRLFPATVRGCTGQGYLPADLSVEEGFCMVRNCRRQMPLHRPEPFLGQSPTHVSHRPPATGGGGEDSADYESEGLLADTAPITNSAVGGTGNKRKPAHISVGKPQRPTGLKPFNPLNAFNFLGKRRRSVDSQIEHNDDQRNNNYGNDNNNNNNDGNSSDDDNNGSINSRPAQTHYVRVNH